MTRRTLPLALVLSSALGCAHPPPRAVHPSPRHRIVVSVVLDQMGTWVLERHLHLLHPDGAIKTLIRQGLWAHRVTYDYAGTYTAPGHAAIYTGAPPAESGIGGNRTWDRRRGGIVGVLDDGVHVELNTGGRTYAAPTALRVDTVADGLRATAAARGQTVVIASLSLKDRGAVIPGGAHPDLALWYTEDARGFTSSTYYGPALPPWVDQWNHDNPASERFAADWVPLDREALAATGIPDNDLGEGDWHGLGIVFPHRLAATDNPFMTLNASPQGAVYLMDMARETVMRLRLGQHDAPDLLMLSVSPTDYVGHVFGPESWEAMDNLVRIDLALGDFLRMLERSADVSVLVTADHGVMPLVEHSRREGFPNASRIEFEDVVAAADHAVDADLGPGDWVAAYVQPFVFMRPAALTPALRGRALAAAARGVATVAGVGAVYDTAEAAGWRTDADPIHRAVARSIDTSVAGELFVVPADHSVVDEKLPAGHGTSHGSPYPLDTEVPVLVAGPGVPHGEITNSVDYTRTAATLAALLGIAPPSHARVPSLMADVPQTHTTREARP